MKLSDFDKVKELVEQRRIYEQILTLMDGGIIASPLSEVDGNFVLHIGHSNISAIQIESDFCSRFLFFTHNLPENRFPLEGLVL